MSSDVDTAGAEPLDAFRAEVRAWIRENLPPSLLTQAKQDDYYKSVPIYPAGDDWAMWKQRVVAKGWGAPTWPVEYGGGGLDKVHGRIVLEEIADAGAFNPIVSMGLSMLGPTLLEHGTEEQKRRHIPPITAGQIRWCQGYSEPGAGSDLASLKTRAEDRGDHFLVNGQKVWNTGAHLAHWCFALVRTDTTRKHEGISFLMIDMSTPGVEARPIKTIWGESPFCEIFFTDVVVPKENLVGEVNKGWSIGKRLLQHEREAVGTNRRPRFGGDVRPIDVIAKEYLPLDDNGRIADAELRAAIVKHMLDARGLQLLQARAAEESATRKGPSEISSILKNCRTRIHQEREELLTQIMGFRGLGNGGEGFTETELAATRAFLSNKAMTIYGGSAEIQNNIIAKHILGLPDHK